MAEAPKLLASRLLRLRIAVASLLVLLLGSLAAPRIAKTQLESAPQEHAAPLLEEQAQRREVEAPFLKLQEVAAEVRRFSVAIATDSRPTVRIVTDFLEPAQTSEAAGFGAYVSPTQILTHASVLDGRTSVVVRAADRAPIEATVAAYEPSTGLVLLTLTSDPLVTAPRAATTDPVAGAIVVGAAHWDGRDIAAPVFVTSVGQDRYAIAGHSLPSGVPLYTLQGELLAIVVNDGAEAYAVPVKDAASRLTSLAATGQRRTAIGIFFQQPTLALAEVVGPRGILVTDVVGGGPADVAGVEPGDLLLAVGNATVDTIETATRVVRELPASTAATLRVRRGREELSVAVTPLPAYEIAALARVHADDATGPEARALFSDAQLEQGGLAPNARILSVNGRALTSRRDVERELTRTRTPLVVLVRQGEHQFFAVIPR